MDLIGSYQAWNLPANIMAIGLLKENNLKIDPAHIYHGLESIVKNTGLKGRWQILSERPLTICDTGHNTDGIDNIVQQLEAINYQKLYIIFGMVKDKDHRKIIERLPKEAVYIFCQAEQPRALPAESLREMAASFGLKGTVVPEVNAAIATAKNTASADDVIFIGGSTFVVAEINEL
jgi:dihydrofolate synthase/folylpolyglutamate synthase